MYKKPFSIFLWWKKRNSDKWNVVLRELPADKKLIKYRKFIRYTLVSMREAIYDL